MAETKKRLPVLKQTPEEEQGEEPRPPWHWVGFGAAATVAAWLPLLYVAEALKARILGARVGGGSEEEVRAAIGQMSPADQARTWAIVIGFPLVPFLVGSLFGGYIVGRWGGDQAGVREASIGGVAAGLIVTVLAGCGGGGLSWVYLVLVAISGGMGALGGKIGLSRRIKAMTPNMNQRPVRK